MKPHRNKAGAEQLLLELAMAGARQFLVNPSKPDRPRIWLCPACGNKLGKGDTCRYHRFSIRARVALAYDHLIPPEPGCACCFCAALGDALREGKDPHEALVDICFAFATGERF